MGPDAFQGEERIEEWSLESATGRMMDGSGAIV